MEARSWDLARLRRDKHTAGEPRPGVDAGHPFQESYSGGELERRALGSRRRKRNPPFAANDARRSPTFHHVHKTQTADTAPSVSAPAELTLWFRSSRRDLPWRTPSGQPRDPWKTLVCEIMSQQTRLEVVVPRWEEWLARWPSPDRLAEASEIEVLSAWAGLGYYSRARNLHRAAKELARSGWPADARGMRELPGVGAYTAAAVASLAFGEPVAMVDGNVARVLSRVHALEGDLRSGIGARTLQQAAEAWIRGRDAAEVNEATMELGALVCSPRSPDCGSCPLGDVCRAARDGEPTRFPTPRARRETVELRATIAVVVQADRILLRRAGPKELLAGHWTLPEVEALPPSWFVPEREVGLVRHAITHHRIVWDVRRGSGKAAEAPEGTSWAAIGEMGSLLVSSLPRKALALAGIGIRRDGARGEAGAVRSAR